MLVLTGLLVLTAATAFVIADAALVGEPVARAAVALLGRTGTTIALATAPDPIVGAVAIAVGVAVLVVAVGFFRLRPWGWTGLMLLAAVSLSINLVVAVFGSPSETSMAVAIAAVLYANQRRIQLLFRGEQVVAFEGTRDVRNSG